jgi:hypothetical protein
VLIGEKLIAESLTAVQSHILVGDILEQLVVRGAPASSSPTLPDSESSPVDPVETSPWRAAALTDAMWRAVGEATRLIKVMAEREDLRKTSSRLSSCWRSSTLMWQAATSNPNRWPVAGTPEPTSSKAHSTGLATIQ